MTPNDEDEETETLLPGSGPKQAYKRQKDVKGKKAKKK